MKRIVLLFLVAAMAIDVSQAAYNSALFEAIAARGPGQSIFHVIIASPVIATILQWALFAVGFGIISVAMALRKRSSERDMIG